MLLSLQSFCMVSTDLLSIRGGSQNAFFSNVSSNLRTLVNLTSAYMDFNHEDSNLDGYSIVAFSRATLRCSLGGCRAAPSFTGGNTLMMLGEHSARDLVAAYVCV